MAQIEVKFDNTLEQTPIVIPLVTPAPGEADEIVNPNGRMNQTMLYGVSVPLVRINDIVLESNQILFFELDGSKAIPKLYLEVEDVGHKIQGLESPGPDNEVRIQLIPRYENAYKKIDLTFYIKSMQVSDNIISLTCVYKVVDLYNSRVKCFGELSSYEFFEKIAGELKLGFATNVEDSETDKRYIYCANDSYESTMAQVISTSGQSGEDIGSRILYDYWIDFWNNVNFVDIYERFNTVDAPEDMQVWISTTNIDTSKQSNDTELYVQTVAELNNLPAYRDTDLHIDTCNPVNGTNQMTQGSDKVISIYNINDGESLDYLLGDGDQQKDVFVKYEYLGECYRDFNYLLAEKCRSTMKNKMAESVYEVTLYSPMFSLMRGSKVNIMWYDSDVTLQDTKDKLGISNDDIDTNINATDDVPDSQGNLTPRLNKIITGQYYILSSIIRFDEDGWTNTLQLTRPRETKQSYVDMSEEIKDFK